MFSSELRNKIIEFAENKITIAELEDWLVPNLPTLIASPTSIDTDIVSVIELGLAELNSGLRSQEELTNYLLEALRDESIKATYPNAIGQTFSSSSSGVASRYANIDISSVDNVNNNIIDWRKVGG
jgi:hypothetical protein